jgi:hypothetical protein
MVYNYYGSDCGVNYLFEECPDKETNTSSGKVRKCWDLVGKPGRRNLNEQYKSVESVLEAWANMFLYTGDRLS